MRLIESIPPPIKKAQFQSPIKTRVKEKHVRKSIEIGHFLIVLFGIMKCEKSLNRFSSIACWLKTVK